LKKLVVNTNTTGRPQADSRLMLTAQPAAA
jgi:hypothetical protein